MAVNSLVVILIRKIGHSALARALGISRQHLESIRVRKAGLRAKQVVALHIVAKKHVPGWTGDDTMAALELDHAKEPFKIRRDPLISKNEAEIERMAKVLCGEVELRPLPPRPPRKKRDPIIKPKDKPKEKKKYRYKRKKVRVDDSSTFDIDDEVV